ncbi:MAG TPA: alpha/beta hydrolase [Anaeromyxobacter sp.]|nr:alpha/beta hydrolase [Anaeromyxobacter sp.]
MPVPSFPSESEARHDEGFLNSADHLRLYWQRYTPPKPRATVAVLHGGGDHSGRYPGITSALVRGGFQVALVDFRGHGQSDGRRWHVDAFSDYLADLDAFVAKLSQDGVANEQLFVVAHSMGALIATEWGLSRGRHLSGFVFSSPFYAPAGRPPLLKRLAAKTVGRALPWLPVRVPFGEADLTTDPDHVRWTERDPLYAHATTPRWYEEATRAQEDVRRRARDWRAPLLVLAAGDDRLASPAAARAFVERAAAEDKGFRVYEGFRHEIFNEAGRDRPVGEAVAWLSQRCRASAG